MDSRKKNIKKLLKYFIVMFCLVSSVTYPQNIENTGLKTISMNLYGTHSIFFLAGFKMNSSTSANVTISEVKAETNFTGSIGYSYWFDNEWSVNITMGIFKAESNVNYTNISSISIIPVLFGFSYYPKTLSLGTAGRVFFGINTGVYIGSGSSTNLNFINFGSSAVIETAFGVVPHTGIDFIISKWLKIGPLISYHFISEFKEVVGNKKNYSGLVFCFNIGLLL